jgi:hypothetical protein
MWGMKIGWDKFAAVSSCTAVAFFAGKNIDGHCTKKNCCLTDKKYPHATILKPLHAGYSLQQ